MDPSRDKHARESQDWNDARTAAGAAQRNGNGTAAAPAARSGSASPPHSERRPPFPERADSSDIPADEGNHAEVAAVQQQRAAGARRTGRERVVEAEPSVSVGGAVHPSRGGGGSGGVVDDADRSVSSLEEDAAHFKMVADRFRALMERRERRLEEAMSDPQTRTDLEAMFPGIREGDYQTLLAGVRGMEEEDFQALLAGARKRRREVRVVVCGLLCADEFFFFFGAFLCVFFFVCVIYRSVQPKVFNTPRTVRVITLSSAAVSKNVRPLLEYA